MIKFANSNDTISVIRQDTSLEDELLPGFYKIVSEDIGPITSYSIVKERNIKLPRNSIRLFEDYDLNVDSILSYFSKRSTEVFQSLYMKQNLGIMLYGIQGTGKTTMCYALAEKFIEYYGSKVLIVRDFPDFQYAVNQIARILEHKDYKFIIIFDECEYAMRNYEGRIKEILDSSTTINNTLFLFTTNYINQIPDAIKNRPSRIKYCVEIEGIKDEIVIHGILSDLNDQLNDSLKVDSSKLNNCIPDLKGKTLDEIKSSFLEMAL